MDGTLDLELMRNFAIALFIGALVGLEREQKKPRGGSGGIRTFILYAEAGAVSAWLAIQLASPGSSWPRCSPSRRRCSRATSSRLASRPRSTD